MHTVSIIIIIICDYYIKFIRLSNKTDFVGMGFWLATTVHFLRAREPFGVSPPLARLGSAARLTLALDSLSLTSPCLATLRLRRGHPALHPSTSTLASSRRLLPSLPASESGPWSSAESTLFATSAWLRAHPRDSTAARSFLSTPVAPPLPVAATAADDDDFSARRRTLIPISKIRLPSKPRIDWQKQRQRAPPKATPAALALFLGHRPSLKFQGRRGRSIP